MEMLLTEIIVVTPIGAGRLVAGNPRFYRNWQRNLNDCGVF